MRIDKIKLQNFRVYEGQTSINFKENKGKNIFIIAGKNGFGKTSFLTSLVWVFYGKLMAQVEDKYRKEINKKGGYAAFIEAQFNNHAKLKLDKDEQDDILSVEVVISDVLIPSVPCKTVSIKRSYNIKNHKEKLELLIDGAENELTKEVGYEVFINDFILPREIAKFFFFDAEKIVSLAEAKSKAELRSLSQAYSEVLGIKKYEELKRNLETLLTNLKRRGVSETEKGKLAELEEKDQEFSKMLDFNQQEQDSLDHRISDLKTKSHSYQEKLIREGNGITLEELNALKEELRLHKERAVKLKISLKKYLGLLPFLIVNHKLDELYEKLVKEQENQSANQSTAIINNKLKSIFNLIGNDIENLISNKEERSEIQQRLYELKAKEIKTTSKVNSDIEILLEFTEEEFRTFEAVYKHIKGSFKEQLALVLQENKNNRINQNRISRKIKQAEARKGNYLTDKIRSEKEKIDTEINKLENEKIQFIKEFGDLNGKYTTHRKLLSEYVKRFNLLETDLKKYKVTVNLLEKINTLIKRIKEEKKYSLQKSITLGLRRLMHKHKFVKNVRVNISEDVMDIDLIDENDRIIDKESLSKGEQQLYATALLQALVEESGIKFPVFIDSPLQKFDQEHSKNIIKEFYPKISEQLVLFPLLVKELSEQEFEMMKPDISQAFMIKHTELKSEIQNYKLDQLFNAFKKQEDVYAH